jgi:hypothetical protein
MAMLTLSTVPNPPDMPPIVLAIVASMNARSPASARALKMLAPSFVHPEPL